MSNTSFGKLAMGVGVVALSVSGVSIAHAADGLDLSNFQVGGHGSIMSALGGKIVPNSFSWLNMTGGANVIGPSWSSGAFKVRLGLHYSFVGSENRYDATAAAKLRTTAQSSSQTAAPQQQTAPTTAPQQQTAPTTAPQQQAGTDPVKLDQGIIDGAGSLVAVAAYVTYRITDMVHFVGQVGAGPMMPHGGWYDNMHTYFMGRVGAGFNLPIPGLSLQATVNSLMPVASYVKNTYPVLGLGVYYQF
jgi:hypothetical protein